VDTNNSIVKRDSTLPQFVEGLGERVAKIASKHIKPESMIRAMLLQVNNNPLLGKCTRPSIAASLLTAAQLGLEFGTARQYAYLIPREISVKGEDGQWRKEWQCQFQTGYRGMLSLARRSTALSDFSAEIVLPGDEFQVRYGTDRSILHIPSETRPQATHDNIRGAYACARIRDRIEFIFLDTYRLNEISQSSYKGDKSYYSKYPGEWARARAFKYLCKQLPLDGEAEQAFSIMDEDDIIDTTATDITDRKALPPAPDPLADVPDDPHQDDKRTTKPADDAFANEMAAAISK